MSSKDRVILLLDQSGSMGSQIDDVIGGVKTFIKAQRDVDPNILMTLYTFSGGAWSRGAAGLSKVMDSIPVIGARFPKEHYLPSGDTPLLDAVGKVLTETKNVKGAKTVVAILTDGEENASQEYTLAKVKALIEKKQAKGWQVVFLGVGIDAFADAGRMGVNIGTTQSYGSTRVALGGLSTATASYLSGQTANVAVNDDDVDNQTST